MKKAFLQKKLARLQERRTALMERGKASQDVNEVRSINDQIGDLDAEIEEVQEELNMIEEEESRSAAANTAPVNGQIVESFQAKAPATATRNEGDTSSMEYRNAFMNYIMRGTPIPANLRVTFPAEVRAGQITSVEDTGAAIPVTVMNEVINTIQKYLDMTPRAVLVQVKKVYNDIEHEELEAAKARFQKLLNKNE